MRTISIIEAIDIINFLERMEMTQTQFINNIGIHHKYFKKIMDGQPPSYMLSERIRKYIEANDENFVEKIVFLAWKEGNEWKGMIEDEPGTNVNADSLNELLDKFQDLI